jgi:hypothetical protein
VQSVAGSTTAVYGLQLWLCVVTPARRTDRRTHLPPKTSGNPGHTLLSCAFMNTASRLPAQAVRKQWSNQQWVPPPTVG